MEFIWQGYMTQRLLSVQKHLSFTLQWLWRLLMRPMYLGLVFSTHIQRHETGTSLIPCPSLSQRLTPSSLKVRSLDCMNTCSYACIHARYEWMNEWMNEWMCVLVCMCTRLCIVWIWVMYVCMYVRSYVCMYVFVCTYICMYVCMYYVCMYVCVYVCMYYVCIYVCIMYVFIYVCMYVRMYAYMYLCGYVYMYVCMYVCMYYVCIYVLCMYLCMYVCIVYVCMYYACMHLCTYVCIYVSMCVCIMYVCMHLCTYVLCMYVRMCVCTMYVCIYVCMYVLIFKLNFKFWPSHNINTALQSFQRRPAERFAKAVERCFLHTCRPTDHPRGPTQPPGELVAVWCSPATQSSVDVNPAGHVVQRSLAYTLLELRFQSWQNQILVLTRPNSSPDKTKFDFRRYFTRESQEKSH
jgi:nuclear pore complex protein Nup62